MSTILVTGGNRGIGLEFVRQYAREGWRVIATCRDLGQANELEALARGYKEVELFELDVAKHYAIESLATTLRGAPIDILLNNAGVMGERSHFSDVDYEWWGEVFRINTMAPLKMAESFIDHVSISDHRIIATISSLMGSISDNGSGGQYIYRSTKAAVNAVVKSLSIDLRSREVGAVTLHPGWVQTDMGGRSAPLTVEESVRGLREVLARGREEINGKFLNYEGEELPW